VGEVIERENGRAIVDSFVPVFESDGTHEGFDQRIINVPESLDEKVAVHVVCLLVGGNDQVGMLAGGELFLDQIDIVVATVKDASFRAFQTVDQLLVSELLRKCF
jgi:hypothetical protein